MNRDKNHNENHQKSKKLLQTQNTQSQVYSRFTPATNLKIGTVVSISNFVKQKGIPEKFLPIRKGPIQIFDKHTDLAYKLIDLTKKEIVQHQTSFYHITQKNTLFTN